MKKLVSLSLYLCLCRFALAQNPGEGAYPFAPLDNRVFDAVNIGNLNTRFNIPLVSRQGRGLPFNYSIQYEGLVWQPVVSGSTTTWVHDPNWGFSGLLNGTTFSGYLTHDTYLSACPRPSNYSGPLPGSSHQTNFVYHDPYGASHRFNYTLIGPCPLTNQSGSQSGDGSSSDGSGYSLLGASQVVTKNGSIITPASSATGQDSTQIVDSNGNTINSSGGNSFTDTLGQTALTITGSSPRLFTYPVTLQSTSATTASASISYKIYTVRTSFQCSGVVDSGSSSGSLVDRVTLADGTFYAFTYEPTPSATDGAVTARLASITLRTGGTINYTYSAGCGAGINLDGTVGSLTRTTQEGKRTYNRSAINANATQTILTDEKGSQTVYDFTIASGLFYETHRQVYQGAAGGSPLMERFTCYNGAVANCDGQVVTPPLTEVDLTTSYNGGSQDISRNTYDHSGNVTNVAKYNGSTLLEQMAYTYNLNSEPLKATITDGSGLVSSTTYGYDEASPAPTSGIPQHSTVASTRGNQTSVTVATSSSATVKTTTAYYDTGARISTTTPNGTTGYVYDATQTFATQTNLPTPSSGVALSTTAAYDVGSTVALSATGLNTGQTSTVTSYDGLLRPTAMTLPNSSQITFSYINANITSVTQTLGSGSTAQSVTLLDGYGRISRSALLNGQGGTNPWYQTDTCYDSRGLVSFASVKYQGPGFGTAPHCSGAGASYGYDALGRVTSITTNDGTATATYLGRATKTITVNGVQKITQYDFLGHIASICEISSNNLAGQSPTNCGTDIAGTGYVTGYGYNLSGHTFSLAQGSQTRYFQTDWVGRPATNSEPERGFTTYSYAYNGTGLVTTRQRPKANQATISVKTTTTTQYDSLSRPVTVTYDDGVTPNKNYFYDSVPSSLQWSQSSSNPKGQLVATSSGSGTTQTRSLFGYDLMGNVTSLLQCAPSICGGSAQASRPLSLGYDLGNNLTSEYDLASGSIGYTRSPTGEVTSITNSTFQGVGNPPNLVSNVSNTPFGPALYTLANGLQTVQAFDTLGRNSGGWVCSGSSQANCANGTQLYGNTVGWSGGNMTNDCDTVENQCQNHGYDEFNRLTSTVAVAGAGSPQGSYTFSYDRWGNRLSQTSSSGGPSPNAAVDPTTNRIVGYSYDAAGNLMSDGLSHSFTYDAEGNVVQVNGGGSGSYVYDALNQRVSVQTSSGTLEYIFDPFGRRTSTWLTTQNFGIEGRIYWDGKQIAYRGQSGYTWFEHKSVLGTERLRTSYQGTAAATESSLAFGDGFKQNVLIAGADQDNAQYAGQDYDAESSSQHAVFRQYSSTVGRWMSPDPGDGSYHFGDPQSFNRYTYALNNPLSATDATGLDIPPCASDLITCFFGGDGGGDGGGGDGGGGGGGVPSCPIGEYCVTTTPNPPPDYSSPNVCYTCLVPNQPTPPQAPSVFSLSYALSPVAQPCLVKIQTAVNNALMTNSTFLGPTSGPGMSVDGYRNGAYNFNYFAPGVRNPVAGSTDGGGRFPGSGLHVPLPGGIDPTISPWGYRASAGGSFFTAHFDTANPFDDLVSLLEHFINDVVLRRAHGC